MRPIGLIHHLIEGKVGSHARSHSLSAKQTVELTRAYGKGSKFGLFQRGGGAPPREIFNYLALAERAVGDMVLGLKMEKPSVYKHLRMLRNVGLVRVRRNGRQMFLSDECGRDPPAP